MGPHSERRGPPPGPVLPGGHAARRCAELPTGCDSKDASTLVRQGDEMLHKLGNSLDTGGILGASDGCDPNGDLDGKDVLLVGEPLVSQHSCDKGDSTRSTTWEGLAELARPTSSGLASQHASSRLGQPGPGDASNIAGLTEPVIRSGGAGGVAAILPPVCPLSAHGVLNTCLRRAQAVRGSEGNRAKASNTCKATATPNAPSVSPQKLS